jgi:hypothetical protein
MIDNDIIKALECCIKSSHFGECFENKCPMVSEEGCSGWTDDKLLKDALDLINRQKAEIERLQKAYLMYEETSGLKKARAEAITEFAERLKLRLLLILSDALSVVSAYDIDQIAKEMKEGVNNA